MTQPTALKTILVATDFSDTAEGGIAWGAELARVHGARLVLCHALMPAMPISPAPEFVPLPADFYENLRDAAGERLEQSAAELRAKGLQVDTALAVGLPAETILSQATAVGAELVVVGTRGLTRWKRILLGSTVQHIVRHAHVPVLTVHPEDLGRHREMRTVLVPTDFSQDATLAAETAVKIAHVSPGARIVLLHAYHVPIEYISPLPLPVLARDAAEVIDAARVEIEKVAATLRAHGLSAETRVLEGYPPELIIAQAREIGADLIALGTHGRTGLKRLFLGSTAERVLPDAPCPVLTSHRG